MIVQPFPSFFPLVLWRLLTSCSSLLLRFPVCKTSSGKRYHLHLIYLLYLRPEISCSIGLCSALGTRPSQIRLHIQFLFVRPRFCPWLHFSASTSGFFQILPHDRHPCLRPTVPTDKSVVDFHHQVVTHAEHTRKEAEHYQKYSASSVLLHKPNGNVETADIEIGFCVILCWWK